MEIFTARLPERKSSKHTTIQFAPAAGNEFSPLAGLLRITTDRSASSYTVSEFPTNWPGRAFHLGKVSGGTDKEAGSYAVFCSARGPEADSCDCKGMTRHGHCKHADAVRALVANGWL